MKNLIVLFLILSASLFPQGWNNYVQTSIPYSFHYQGGIDQFTNKNGINLLVNSGYPLENLKYYLINTSGSIIISYTFEN